MQPAARVIGRPKQPDAGPGRGALQARRMSILVDRRLEFLLGGGDSRQVSKSARIARQAVVGGSQESVRGRSRRRRRAVGEVVQASWQHCRHPDLLALIKQQCEPARRARRTITMVAGRWRGCRTPRPHSRRGIAAYGGGRRRGRAGGCLRSMPSDRWASAGGPRLPARQKSRARRPARSPSTVSKRPRARPARSRAIPSALVARGGGGTGRADGGPARARANELSRTVRDIQGGGRRVPLQQCRAGLKRSRVPYWSVSGLRLTAAWCRLISLAAWEGGRPVRGVCRTRSPPPGIQEASKPWSG